MKTIFKIAAITVAATAAISSYAQDSYPANGKAITIIVPFTAGGPTDKVARDLSEAMRKHLIRDIGPTAAETGAGELFLLSSWANSLSKGLSSGGHLQG